MKKPERLSQVCINAERHYDLLGPLFNHEGKKPNLIQDFAKRLTSPTHNLLHYQSWALTARKGYVNEQDHTAGDAIENILSSGCDDCIGGWIIENTLRLRICPTCSKTPPKNQPLFRAAFYFVRALAQWIEASEVIERVLEASLKDRLEETAELVRQNKCRLCGRIVSNTRGDKLRSGLCNRDYQGWRSWLRTHPEDETPEGYERFKQMRLAYIKEDI